MTRRLVYIGVAVVVALLIGVFYAEAGDARCFTTDDGEYACSLEMLDADGSFEISADGYPTFSLWIDEPGRAAGFVNFGERDVGLPGFYLRQEDDPACWHNPDTDTRICVR